LTENQGHDHFPIWSLDGKNIFTSSYRIGGNGIHKLTRFSIDGLQQPEVLLETQNNDWPCSITPDGKTMIFRRQNDQGDNDLYMLSLDGSQKFKTFLKTPNNESSPTISPDGRWIAYTSDKSGRYEIYIRPFPGPGGFIQVSIEGGIEPCWAPDGKTIFYSTRRGTKIYKSSFQDKPQLVIGHPQLLFENENWSDFNGERVHYRNYDISPDGKRFIIAQTKTNEKHPFIIVINWLEELKAKMTAAEVKQ
jgi:Tol biopolymer transport system component